MYCQCGCGQLTPIATRTRSKRNTYLGKPMCFIKGHRKRKGTALFGFYIKAHNRARQKRWYIFTRNSNGSHKLWARIVMENKLFDQTGVYRELKKTEIVHHEDEDYLNDSPSNLILTNNRLHQKDFHGSIHLAYKKLYKPIILIKDFMIIEFCSYAEANRFLGLGHGSITNRIKRGIKAAGWIPIPKEKFLNYSVIQDLRIPLWIRKAMTLNKVIKCRSCGFCCFGLQIRFADGSTKPKDTFCPHYKIHNSKGCCNIYNNRPIGCIVFVIAGKNNTCAYFVAMEKKFGPDFIMREK